MASGRREEGKDSHGAGPGCVREIEKDEGTNEEGEGPKGEEQGRADRDRGEKRQH